MKKKLQLLFLAWRVKKISGHIQYQFKGCKEHREKNFVVHFSGITEMLVKLTAAALKRPNGIFIFINYEHSTGK